MLRKIRITLALVFWVSITLLFLDFTGTLHGWLGWMAKIQFIPAILALNVGIVLILVALTLIFGRIYCSIICPLGVMQDAFGWLGRRGRKKRNKYSYSPAKNLLRYGFLILFIVLLVIGMTYIAALIAPYSAYGRIAQTIIAPIYYSINNLFALIAEHIDSYAFYHKDIVMPSVVTLVVAIVTLTIIGILAWRNGRTYCNTVCPVGTVLGFLSRYSWMKPVIDTEKCNRCGLCGRRCKAACIDTKAHVIDYSRCVACMDCIDNCSQHAISYTFARKKNVKSNSDIKTDIKDSDTTGRREFIATVGVIAGSMATQARVVKTVDGGLAAIEDKKVPDRNNPILPPGAVSLDHLTQHCTACQLCISQCPNDVLHPSTSASSFMQPECSYEKGYCRPECTRCGDVCPTGAIHPLTQAEKSSLQIGHAVWIKSNCLPITEGVSCGNCARHCPAGAITMVPSDPSDPESVKIPVVNDERCIGCGTCENLCPARPFSAIYVEGNLNQHTI